MTIVFVSDLLQARHPSFHADLAAQLARFGIALRAIFGTRDIWCRDFMPVPIGGGKLVQFRYAPDYLADAPELITAPEIGARAVGTVIRSELIVDGGNVVRRGRVAVMTEKVLTENVRLSRAEVVRRLHEDLEIDDLVLIPVEAGDVCGHADGVLHLIDERAALVNDYSGDGYGRKVERRLREHGIESVRVSYAPDLRSRRRVPPATGVYVNLLEMAEAVFVPTYGIGVDEPALAAIGGAFVGRSVVPIDCWSIACEGGALRCVTWASSLRP